MLTDSGEILGFFASSVKPTVLVVATSKEMINPNQSGVEATHSPTRTPHLPGIIERLDFFV
jgi:hypothetical protein